MDQLGRLSAGPLLPRTPLPEEPFSAPVKFIKLLYKGFPFEVVMKFYENAVRGHMPESLYLPVTLFLSYFIFHFYLAYIMLLGLFKFGVRSTGIDDLFDRARWKLQNKGRRIYRWFSDRMRPLAFFRKFIPRIHISFGDPGAAATPTAATPTTSPSPSVTADEDKSSRDKSSRENSTMSTSEKSKPGSVKKESSTSYESTSPKPSSKEQGKSSGHAVRRKKKKKASFAAPQYVGLHSTESIRGDLKKQQ